MEFPGVFVFDLGISKGSNTILYNIHGLSFVLSGISRGKAKKWQIPGGRGFKKVYPQPSCLDFFSGIAQYGASTDGILRNEYFES